MYYYKVSNELGGIFAAASNEELMQLWIAPQQKPEYINSMQEKLLPVFVETQNWLSAYFDGQNPSFMPKMYIEGTAFQKMVYDILLQIPYGKTMTYKQIANIIERKTSKKMAAQAVGGAVGANPISILVPCHRVIGTSGRLTGYAGGIELKKALLKLEKIAYKE